MKPQEKPCKDCDTKLEYSEQWDAFYCPKCNVWTEKNCGYPLCSFCAGRPEKPIKEES